MIQCKIRQIDVLVLEINMKYLCTALDVIIIDENLRWNKHTVLVERKIRTTLRSIYTLKNYVYKQTLKMDYYALIDSILKIRCTGVGLGKEIIYNRY